MRLTSIFTYNKRLCHAERACLRANVLRAIFEYQQQAFYQDFLYDRKYRVMANGMMSDEQVMISGVRQGTVLSSIFFIIIISDIDENLKNSIVELYAEDTRVSAKIRTKEDEEMLQ